ncbi:aminotransferase class I/II-fold pyridoxal phosphate-dependent enzyme [Paenibacillus melissococcoides]|uniref:Aminotransferase class I/II-fold pyridoxal phosphate-dependent enzyme n=1 Tax=Paenibacillus melissococcoides TaxID=2912268 RepID=A0ABM9FZI0_9BACL|nr:aminotransferase class I/II-fold pyridoxal phosphate-dependent enzyme [Paenibacillus melissococcoides]
MSLSPAPVELAYNQLAAEGFIASVPRKGYYVQHLPEPYLRLGIGDEPQRPSQEDAITQRAAPARDARTYPYDFHLSSIDGTHFPYRVWRSIFQELLAPERKELLWYGDPQGEPGLREKIAKYTHQFRGVRCTKEQVIVGSDPHVLLTMLAKLLREHAGHIAVKNPGYLLCPATFRQQGYEVMPVSLEEDGIPIGDLYDSAARREPQRIFPRLRRHSDRPDRRGNPPPERGLAGGGSRSGAAAGGARHNLAKRLRCGRLTGGRRSLMRGGRPPSFASPSRSD